MRLLLIHQNFPAQFRFAGPALAAMGHQVVGLGMREEIPLAGVRYVRHQPSRASTRGIHPLAGDFETKMIRAEAVMNAVRGLIDQGFTPDRIAGHMGWGETLLLKELLPDVPLLGYSEFYYHTEGVDVGFDPEWGQPDLETRIRVSSKNFALLQALERCDRAFAPTRFQRSLVPWRYRDKVAVIPDGVDTEQFRPNPNTRVTIHELGLTLSASDEVVTYVARSLEPYRGFPTMMRAIPKILAERPRAQIILIGNEGVSYGAPHPEGISWKQAMERELGDALDPSRVHFVGRIAHDALRGLYQISGAHVYLTYPFVPSWSLLEAMASGALVIGSDNPPVDDFIRHGETGLMVDFFSPDALADAVIGALADRRQYQALRDAARRHVLDHHDLNRHTIPAQTSLILDPVGARLP